MFSERDSFKSSGDKPGPSRSVLINDKVSNYNDNFQINNIRKNGKSTNEEVRRRYKFERRDRINEQNWNEENTSKTKSDYGAACSSRNLNNLYSDKIFGGQGSNFHLNNTSLTSDCFGFKTNFLADNSNNFNCKEEHCSLCFKSDSPGYVSHNKRNKNEVLEIRERTKYHQSGLKKLEKVEKRNHYPKCDVEFNSNIKANLPQVSTFRSKMECESHRFRDHKRNCLHIKYKHNQNSKDFSYQTVNVRKKRDCYGVRRVYFNHQTKSVEKTIHRNMENARMKNTSFENQIYEHEENCVNLTEEDLGITEYVNNGEKFSCVFNNVSHDYHIREISETNEVANITTPIIPAEIQFHGNFDTYHNWPPTVPQFVHFILYKQEVNTLEVIHKLSEALKIRTSLITVYSCKEKQSSSYQWFSVKRINPIKLLKTVKKLHEVKIGNICTQREPLKLGCHKGNRYIIALRKVTSENDAITKALESLKVNGFVNYFGLKRFGKDVEIPLHEIGCQMFHQNWKKVVNLILKPVNSDSASTEVKKAKLIYQETGDLKLAERCFKHSNKTKSLVGRLILGLSKRIEQKDFISALNFIPLNIRLSYIFAFQSLVWNKVLSRRIKEYGFKPLIGDLVLVDRKDPDNEELVLLEGGEDADINAQTWVPAFDALDIDIKINITHKPSTANQWMSDEITKTIAKKNKLREFIRRDPSNELLKAEYKALRNKVTADIRKAKRKFFELGDQIPGSELPSIEEHLVDKKSKFFQDVKVVTENDVEQTSIYDVVLPLPGYNVIYPKNEIVNWYRKIMQAYGLDLSLPEEKNNSYSFCGCYRHILSKIKNLSWTSVDYDNENDNIIGSELPKFSKESKAINSAGSKYKAIIMDFCLPPTCYPSMALREITKLEETQYN